MRNLVLLGWALFSIGFGIDPLFAASCDCKNDVSNASAVTTDTCSKTWKDNHCTLNESGAASRFTANLDMLASLSGHGLLADDKSFSQAASAKQKLDQLRDIMDRLKIPRSNSSINDFSQIPFSLGSRNFLLDARISGSSVSEQFLFWVVTDAMLLSFEEFEIRDAVESSFSAGVQDAIMSNEIKDGIASNGKALRFGQGCYLFGDTSSYVSIDLNPMGFRCPKSFIGP